MKYGAVNHSTTHLAAPVVAPTSTSSDVLDPPLVPSVAVVMPNNTGFVPGVAGLVHSHSKPYDHLKTPPLPMTSVGWPETPLTPTSPVLCIRKKQKQEVRTVWLIASDYEKPKKSTSIQS